MPENGLNRCYCGWAGIDRPNNEGTLGRSVRVELGSGQGGYLKRRW